MLRLPKFRVLEPRTAAEAVRLRAEHGDAALFLAGGTDLLPNMKHGLFEPEVVISLARVEGLGSIEEDADGALRIGAMVSLHDVATSELVRRRAPALAEAAGVVSGPQLRRMGTLGGNVMLDTRCQWYNQTHFWRQALGFCLKKDGTVCHVVESGKKCVAAASNDTAPALLTLGATLVFEGADGTKELGIADLYRADGANNKSVSNELLRSIRIPPTSPGHRGAYGKLRDRGSIDFPLLGIAVRIDLAPDDRTVEDAALAGVALQARPLSLPRAAELFVGTETGTDGFRNAVDALADLAYRRFRPLDNIPGDAEWRREMAPVLTRRTLLRAVEASAEG